MSVQRSHEIHHRDDFPLLCNWRCLFNNAVEVGVDRGEFSNCFLNRWYGQTYYGVDSYRAHCDAPEAREGDFQSACIRYERHSRRAHLVRVRSIEAPLVLKETYMTTVFDFGYIDAEHDYLSVVQDIEIWWPLISKNGILAGHDYAPGMHDGVVRAVDEFAERFGLTVYLTHEIEEPASWYVYKSGIPGPDWKRLNV